MRNRQHLSITYLLSFIILIASSCSKSYTKEEITTKIKEDKDFIELIQIKSSSYSKTLNSTKPLTTPTLVKAYVKAKSNGDIKYLNSVRAQIYRTSDEERKRQNILHLRIYKRYIRKGLISRTDFQEMYKQVTLDEYKKVYKAFYHMK